MKRRGIGHSEGAGTAAHYTEEVETAAPNNKNMKVTNNNIKKMNQSKIPISQMSNNISSITGNDKIGQHEKDKNRTGNDKNNRNQYKIRQSTENVEKNKQKKMTENQETRKNDNQRKKELKNQGKKKCRRKKRNNVCTNKIKIFYNNINGINSKKDHLAAILKNEKPHIVALCETKTSKLPKMEGYKWIAQEKPIYGGGVAIAAREDIANRTKEIDTEKEENMELTWIELNTNHQRLIII